VLLEQISQLDAASLQGALRLINSQKTIVVLVRDLARVKLQLDAAVSAPVSTLWAIEPSLIGVALKVSGKQTITLITFS